MDYEGKQVMIVLYPFLLEVEVNKKQLCPLKAFVTGSLLGQEDHWHFVGSPDRVVSSFLYFALLGVVTIDHAVF